MNIRRATKADTGVMRRLWDDFTVEATFAPYPGNPFQAALVTDHIALLAEENGEPVGTVYANLASPHFGFVFGLYTIPAARGKGVGRALMREIAVGSPRSGPTSTSSSTWIPRTRTHRRSTSGSVSPTRRACFARTSTTS